MSWLHPNIIANKREHASVSEIVQCFRDRRTVLNQLAFLITGNQPAAGQAVVNARSLTLAGSSPFSEWLFEWAKAATITSAISGNAEGIRACEPAYRNQRCRHLEHLSQGDDAEREFNLNFVLQTDPLSVISGLDPLSRAILVLRVAIRSSIQDCVVHLNVPRAIVLAATCRAMTWLHDLRTKQAIGNSTPSSSAFRADSSP